MTRHPSPRRMPGPSEAQRALHRLSRGTHARVLACIATILALIALAQSAFAQSLDGLKAGVVRITSQADELRRTGTGFIVRLEKDAAFIVTASHVVEGDDEPRVEFFTRRNTAVTAEVLRIEGGDPRGLALLAVRGALPPGLQALPLAGAETLGGGEPVVVIGFPQGGGAWAVLRASVVSQEGRELTLDGSIGEGNSGGPVLREGRVIGVVTTVGGGGGFGRATPAALVRLVLDGWGVRLAEAARAPAAPAMPATSSRAKVEPPEAPPAAAANPNAGKGQVRVVRARCERLQSATAFRVTLHGEGEGPEGATVKVSFTRDGREITRPRPTCRAWSGCVRGAGDPPRTDWQLSTMIIAPAPTDATVSVQDAVRGNPENAYGQASVELGCLLL